MPNILFTEVMWGSHMAWYVLCSQEESRKLCPSPRPAVSFSSPSSLLSSFKTIANPLQPSWGWNSFLHLTEDSFSVSIVHQEESRSERRQTGQSRRGKRLADKGSVLEPLPSLCEVLGLIGLQHWAAKCPNDLWNAIRWTKLCVQDPSQGIACDWKVERGLLTYPRGCVRSQRHPKEGEPCVLLLPVF